MNFTMNTWLYVSNLLKVYNFSETIVSIRIRKIVEYIHEIIENTSSNFRLLKFSNRQTDEHRERDREREKERERG